MMSCKKSLGFFLEINYIKYFRVKMCVFDKMFFVYFLCDVCSKTLFIVY